MTAWLIFFTALAIIFLSTRLSSSTFMGRVISLVGVMLGATMIVSGGLRLVPGDPIDHILGDQVQDTNRERLAKSLGLMGEDGREVGFVEQYGNFIKSLATLNIDSFITRRNAFEILLERLPYTIALALSAMVIAIILGPIFGILSSLFYNRWPDHLFSTFALIGISIPSFFLGPLLLLLFAIELRWLPISGADNGLLSLVLPAISMGTALAAMLSRMSRASMLEILSEDFIRTASAKGLPPKVVFFKHALRNALIPVITIIGLQFGALLAGAVVTEKVFNWPGIGLLLVESIQQLDMPMVQVTVLFIAFIYGFINLITDMLYGQIDPRIKIEGSTQ